MSVLEELSKSFQDLIEELEFTTEYEYFDYIMSTMDNGLRGQAKHLFLSLKTFGKTGVFKLYVEDLYGPDALLKILKYVT